MFCGLNLAPKYWINPFNFSEIKPMLEKRGDYFVAPSKHIAREYFENLDFKGLENKMRVIHNGIDTSNFSFSDKHDDYLLFLGRIVERKGLHDALEAAQETGFKIIVAGGNNSNGGDSQYKDNQYFEKFVKPLLNGNVEWYGPANLAQKVGLLQEAKAVLFPSIDEPFGFVPIEAMSCGTPVIAYNEGGPKETIRDGVTGFLANNYDKFVNAIHKLDSIDRRNCHEHVKNNFGYKTMAENWSKLISSRV